MKVLNAILIGAGTMGKRHKSRLERLGVRFADVVDVAEAAAFPASLDQRSEKPDFVVVASPAQTHYEYVKNCLDRKIPVLVEKPLAVDAGQAQELVDLARAKGTVLFVAQSECFNPIYLNFRKHFLEDLKNAVAASRFDGGDGRSPLNVKLEFRREHGYSERCRDVNVSLDLLVHDVSLFLNLFEARDIEVVDDGRSHGECDCNDKICVVMKVVSGKFAGVVGEFIADRNSDRDIRTISVEFGRNGNVSGFDYSVSLARYTESGNVAHIPDSLDNEHRFFLKLLSGTYSEWGWRAAQTAADIVRFVTV